MTLTAVVVGATGLVGQSLVSQLVQSESFERVVTITRRPLAIESPKLDQHIVDFENLVEHSSAFQGDVLFSCLGTTKKQAGSIAAQYKVDVEYQYNAIELANKNNTPHLCLVSSSGARSASSSAYLKMKGELEEKVKKLPFERVSIFQPSLLLGSRPESRIAEKLGAIVLPSICKLPGLKRYCPIKGDQVAKKMLQVSLQHKQGIEYFVLDDVFPNT